MATVLNDERGFDVVESATGAVLERLPEPSAMDVRGAVSHAATAASLWARTPAAERAEHLRDAARAIEEQVDALGVLCARETGKLLADARGGVLAGIGALRQYAELGPLHRGRSLCGDWDALDVMLTVPRGVAAVIVPWNDPVAIACQGVAANLAVGNTVVVKPSERAPLSVRATMRLIEACLPGGVLQVLVGGGDTGARLVADPRIDAVVFTGSITTGRRIAARCASDLKKVVLELGGKDALVVDEGVDPAWAAQQIATAAFANAGQLCVSAERIFVHDAIARDVIDALAAIVSRHRLGDPLSTDTTFGPLVDEQQVAHVTRHVDDALARGASLVAGGERGPGSGAFFKPTVVVGATPGMLVNDEETFGPVAPIRVVRSFDEALTLADHHTFGLAAVVLTPNMAHAQRALRELQVGTVKVNAAFGGAPGGAAHPHRLSGSGFGYGPELLDELTRVRVAHVEPPPA